MAPYHGWKFLADRVLAALLLISLLPVIALMVLAVRLTSSGPGFFRQLRVGRDGDVFLIWKIRTMYGGDANQQGGRFTKPGDSGVTPLGRVLRKLHLDEFPQLFNVVLGEMALVGPRPLRPEDVQVLTRQNPGYMKRSKILPGVTGLAQVCMGPELDRDSVARKLTLDVAYVKDANLLLDFKILLCTASLMLGIPKRQAVRAVGIRRAYLGEEQPGPAMSRGIDVYSPAGPAFAAARVGHADQERQQYSLQESLLAQREPLPR